MPATSSLLPRIHISPPLHAPIPTSRSRQFVRSTARHDPAAERAARETFWPAPGAAPRCSAPSGPVASRRRAARAAAGRAEEVRSRARAAAARIGPGPGGGGAQAAPRASAAALRLPDLELRSLEAPRRAAVDELVPVALRLRNRRSPHRGHGPARRARVRAGAPGRGGEPARHVAAAGAAAVVVGALGPGEERRVEGVVQVCFVEEGWRRCAGGWRRSVQ